MGDEDTGAIGGSGGSGGTRLSLSIGRCCVRWCCFGGCCCHRDNSCRVGIEGAIDNTVALAVRRVPCLSWCARQWNRQRGGHGHPRDTLCSACAAQGMIRGYSGGRGGLNAGGSGGGAGGDGGLCVCAVVCCYGSYIYVCRCVRGVEGAYYTVKQAYDRRVAFPLLRTALFCGTVLRVVVALLFVFASIVPLQEISPGLAAKMPRLSNAAHGWCEGWAACNGYVQISV